MKYTLIILCFGFIFGLSGCELDGFLFNIKKVDTYVLPGNTIPLNLIESVELNSDNNKIYGYWIKSDSGHQGRTIFYCHGNKYNLDEYWDRVMIMHKMGFNVFIFDYRGFGKSEGESSEDAIRKDAEVALDFVLNQKKVPADSMTIYGFSLGSVPSIYLSANKITPSGLIVESGFASANSLTQTGAGLDLPPLWLTGSSFNNADQISKVKTKVMIIHAKDDDFIRYEDNALVLYKNAPDPKKLVPVNADQHSAVIRGLGEDVYIKTITDWILTGK